MKFRRLTNEELAPLEKKFIQFLVANTITGDDWAKMKERRPEQAMGLVDIFSDLMFEETFMKVHYLTQKTPKELHVFYFDKEKIQLLGLVAGENTAIDFTKDDEWLKNLQNIIGNPDNIGKGGISFFQTEKEYADPREVEIFKMIENGCRISDCYLYDTLKKLFNA